MSTMVPGKHHIQVERLPEITEANIEEINSAQIAKYVHKENVTPYLFQGFLEMPIHVGEKVRTAKIYVPEDNVTGTSFIMMNVPDDENPIDFIIDSGWREIADREHMPLFIMEPEEGKSWKSPEDEWDYIAACFEAQKAGVWLNPGFCRYAVGYGKIGADLQKFVMKNPLTFGGSAFLNASELPLDYLKETAGTEASFGSKNYGFSIKEVPSAVLILNEMENERTRAVKQFWKTAAGDPNAVIRYSEGGPDIFKDAVKAETGKFDPGKPETTEKIWSHIGRYYRYGMGYLSNHLYYRLDYKKLGVEFRSMTDSSGIDHNFLVYVPRKYRESTEKLPLVFSFHGWSNTMRQQFENTLWYEIADREGFIVACPENRLYLNTEQGPTTRNQMANPKWCFMIGDFSEAANDVIYFRGLLDLLEKEYPIDPDRVYANGQSMGCGETLFLAESAQGDRLAAVASTSGLPLLSKRPKTAGRIIDRSTSHVPTFVMMGEYDLWDTDIKADHTLLTEGADAVLKRLGLADEENVKEVRLHKATDHYKEGRFDNMIWTNRQGIPQFRYTVVDQHCHAITPFECRAAWYEWMSQFRLDSKTGKRYYRGIEIAD